VRLFKKRDENDVFMGGEEAPRLDRQRRHMWAWVIMTVAFAVITIFNWYIISHLLHEDPTLRYWVYSILLTMYIGWIMVAHAVLSLS